MQNDVYAQMAEKIIKVQENIIGPIALEQAEKVQGLKIDWPKHDIKFEGNQKDIVGKLVERYEKLFGQTSVEMCKDAVKSIVSQVSSSDLPALLQ